MQTSSLLLLCFLSILGPEIVLSKYGECSCLGLANVRKVIPDDAGQARELLYKIWKISQKDFCKATFKSLPASALGLGRRKEKLGTLVKLQAEELKKLVGRHFWESWVLNRDMYAGTTPEYTALSINQRIESKLGVSHNVGYTLPTEFFLSQLEELVPNLDFIDSFELNSEDVKEALEGLACSWTSDSSSFEFEFGNDFERVMDTKGVENVDLENAREVAAKFMYTILNEDLQPLINNTMQKYRSLVQNMLPGFHEFHNFSTELQSGKKIGFENLFIRILEETDKVIEQMDEMFEGACQQRNSYLNDLFSTFLKNIFRFATQSINENNKIDFNKFVGLLSKSNADGFIKEIIASLEAVMDTIKDKLEKGNYALVLLNYFVKLVCPQTAANISQWTEYEEIYNVKAEVLTAGAVQMFVNYYGTG